VEVTDQGARAGVPPFHPLRSMWENERVMPIFDDDIDSISHGDKQQQQQQILMEDGILGPGVPGVLPSSRARRSNWRMESRYAELLVANSEFPFCAWDATTYVHMRMLCYIGGLVHFNQPSHHFIHDTHSDASIYTPLLLDPNAVYQPQLLSFAANADRVYRIEARCVPKNTISINQSGRAPLNKHFHRHRHIPTHTAASPRPSTSPTRATRPGASRSPRSPTATSARCGGSTPTVTPAAVPRPVGACVYAHAHADTHITYRHALVTRVHMYIYIHTHTFITAQRLAAINCTSHERGTWAGPTRYGGSRRISPTGACVDR